MDDIIAQITDLEKKSADDIAKARILYKEKADNIRNRIIEERKQRKKDIIEKYKNKKLKKIEEVKSDIEKEQRIISVEKEKLLENHSLCKRLTDSVISIILDS